MSEDVLKIDVTFESGIGQVEDDAFAKSLPEDLPLDVFQRVDDHRDDFTGALATAMLDEVENGSADDEYTISGVSLGGNLSIDMTVNKDQHLTIARNFLHNDCLETVIGRAEDLYREAGKDD